MHADTPRNHSAQTTYAECFFFFFIFCLWNHDCWNRWNINSGIFILSQQADTHTHTDVLWVKHPRQKQSGLKWKNTSREEISEPRHLSRETFCSCLNNCCTVSPTPPGFTSKPAMKMHSVLFSEHELHSNMLSSAPVWSYRDTEHILALYMTIRPKLYKTEGFARDWDLKLSR